MCTVPLALLLLRASRWFDRQLLDRLPQEGWPALSPAQSLVFAYLDADGTPPAELARRLGNTRQATSQLVDGLVRLDLLALDPNPARRGGRLVVLTDRGRHLAADAHRILHTLETEFGPAASDLRRLLCHFDQTDPGRFFPEAVGPPAAAADTSRESSASG